MRKLFLICILAMLSTALGHKSYISISDMAYNDSLKQIEVSLKVTAHDFERILYDKFRKTIDIENVGDTSKVNHYIKQYINYNFKIKSGGTETVLNYIGQEVTVRDELFFYFTFNQVSNPDHIFIQNSILFTLFSEQQNIVHYKYNGKIKSITLHANKQIGEIKF